MPTLLEKDHALEPESLRASALAALRGGNLPEAIPQLEELVRCSPQDAEAHGYLGVALGANGEGRRSVEILGRAASLAPRSAAIHYNLGRALEQVGEVPAARDAYRQATLHEPRHALSLEALRRLAPAEEHTVAIPAPPQPGVGPSAAEAVAPTNGEASDATQSSAADLSAYLAAMNAPRTPPKQASRWKAVGELLVMVMLVIAAAVALSQVAVRL